MDTVRQRVEDALALWAMGRREGAFLLAIVAVITKARAQFPQPMSEGEAFRRFIESKFATRISVEYRGRLWPVEDIFYKWFRCEIVHAGGLPADVLWLDAAGDGELSVRAGGAPDYVLLVSPGWFHGLIGWASS